MDWLIEEPSADVAMTKQRWQVLIVDDDIEVHKVTRLSLMDFIFEGKNIEFVSAFSGKEALELLSSRDDIALVLLDVVMESDDAGLQVAKAIRNNFQNYYTRVVLRTGQPGFAPVDDVMRDYDIDGYLSKTDMTKQKLGQAFYVALRSYRDLIRIQKYQKGLEAVINAIANLTQIDEILELARAIMSQLDSVLCIEQSEFIVQGEEIFTLTQHQENIWRIVVDQEDAKFLYEGDEQLSCRDYIALSRQALVKKESIFTAPYYVHYYRSARETETIFLLKTEQKLNYESKKLLHAFSVQVVLTIENLLVKK